MEMLDCYQQWINNYSGDIFRKCKEVSLEMQSVFPELRIAKGLVQIIENNKWYQHQWCVDQTDNIVDPTARQWQAIIAYKEIKDTDPKPVGKCMNCGEFVFSDSKFGVDVCSKQCYDSMISEIWS